MSIETLKLEKGLCRCCLNEGVHKNLAEPWLKAGGVEIYADMLQSCLDINLTPLPGPHCNVTYTICEACIERLRDACSFKQQVNECERRFREYYSKSDIKLGSCIDIEVKRENIDDEDIKLDLSPIHDDDDFRLDDFDGDDETKVSDVDIKSGPRKLRPKKAKASEKAKAKSKPARKPKDEAANPESRKKVHVTPEDLADFKVVAELGVKKYHCNKCESVLSCVDSMNQHILADHNDECYRCPICMKKFKQKRSKRLHLATKHNLEEATVNHKKVLRKCLQCVCEVCKQKMKSCYLTEHMLTHKMADCPECNISIKRTELLKHRSASHGVPILQIPIQISTCGICGYKNLSKSRMIKHQRRVHLKEKNHACTECDAAFFDATALRQHMVAHNPVKAFECGFCKKKFPRASALRAHEKIHTGEKNKVCHVCNERFVQKASLNYHIMKHHPDLC